MSQKYGVLLMGVDGQIVVACFGHAGLKRGPCLVTEGLKASRNERIHVLVADEAQRSQSGNGAGGQRGNRRDIAERQDWKGLHDLRGSLPRPEVPNNGVDGYTGAREDLF